MFCKPGASDGFQDEYFAFSGLIKPNPGTAFEYLENNYLSLH